MNSLKKSLSLVIFLLAFGLSVYAQEENRLKFNPEHLVAGQNVELLYTPLPSMTGYSQIPGVVYSYEHFRWIGHDIMLQTDGKVWKATYKIPEEAGLLAFKFKAGDIVDHGMSLDYPFAALVADNTGRYKEGAYAGWGFLRSEKYDRYIPDYMDFSKGEVSDTIVYHWLDQEVRNCRASNVPMASLYIEAMRNAKIDNVENEAKRVVKYLLNEGSEDALLGAMRITQTSNPQQSDSILKAILVKYPKGKWALKCRYDLVGKVNGNNQRKDAFLQLLKDFPQNDEFDSMLETYGHSYDGIYQSIIYTDYINNQKENILSYVHKMSLGGVLNIFYRLVQIPHNRKDIADKELYPFAKDLVDYLEQLKKTKPYRYAYLSDSEWEKTAESMIGNVVHLPYAEILNSIGETEKSLEYARRAQTLFNYQSASLNELMANLFKKTGNNKELQNLLEKSVFSNQVSESQMTMLKELYIENHKSDKGYEAYVEGLKNPSEKSAIKKAVVDYKKTGVMPAWRLIDSKGKTVSSEQLKGKVYVLDFWSTWCVPCKASLPGMKLAVEHYKNDKNVAFYFVDTQEFSPNFKESSAKYLKEKGFDFNLLYDGKTPGKKVNDVLCNQVMNKYTISGIPMKVIVDRNGNIRFLAIGYKGSPSELKDEIVEMIEQAKLY